MSCSALAALLGVPDGMTIDADDKLWVVLGESGCVVQARLLLSILRKRNE